MNPWVARDMDGQSPGEGSGASVPEQISHSGIECSCPGLDMSHGFLRDMRCSASSRPGPIWVQVHGGPLDASPTPQGCRATRGHLWSFGRGIADASRPRYAPPTRGTAPQHHTAAGELQQSHVIATFSAKTNSNPTSRPLLGNASYKAEGADPRVLNCSDMHLRKLKEQKEKTRMMPAIKEEAVSGTALQHHTASGELLQSHVIATFSAKRNSNPTSHPLPGNAFLQAKRADLHVLNCL
ncbi:uncharacterized protein LOC144177519 [Haemaphysalis longicornis]